MLDVQTSAPYCCCMTFAPGQVRDSIVGYLEGTGSASLDQIYNFVSRELGDVPASSVRSYLNLNCPDKFTRLETGRYALASSAVPRANGHAHASGQQIGRSTLY